MMESTLPALLEREALMHGNSSLAKLLRAAAKKIAEHALEMHALRIEHSRRTSNLVHNMTLPKTAEPMNVR